MKPIQPESSSLPTASSFVDSSFCTVVLMCFSFTLVAIIRSLQQQISSLKSELATERKASCKMDQWPGIDVKSEPDSRAWPVMYHCVSFTARPSKNPAVVSNSVHLDNNTLTCS